MVASDPASHFGQAREAPEDGSALALSRTAWARRRHRTAKKALLLVGILVFVLFPNRRLLVAMQLAQLDRVNLLLEKVVRRAELLELGVVKVDDLLALAVERGTKLLRRRPLCALRAPCREQRAVLGVLLRREVCGVERDRWEELFQLVIAGVSDSRAAKLTRRSGPTTRRCCLVLVGFWRSAPSSDRLLLCTKPFESNHSPKLHLVSGLRETIVAPGPVRSGECRL